ncbi:MAG TPA: tetratricopeptide repeat protein [Geobacteraceae bacterium]
MLSSLVLALLLVVFPVRGASAAGETYHWVDREGFHSVATLAAVPLEHRKDLPMARNRTSLPFTEEEDRDGSMYVWFVLGQAGIDYRHTRAADFPSSRLFAVVAVPQDGDIAWWPGFVALKGGEKLLTARREEWLSEVEKKRGAVKWYRYNGPPPGKKGVAVKGAPRAALQRVDKVLGTLEPAATYPPRIANEGERGRLKQQWQKAVAELERLRRQFPDDPRVLGRLGECYRLGRNLGIPQTWARAEAFLLRTEELDPEAPETYISLGAHYADTGYGDVAEAQFRQALRHARKNQLPQVWWGLAISLYYQGKTKEALDYAERLVAAHPQDASAKKLRQTILDEGAPKE